MTRDQIFAIFELIFIVATVVLFFIGTRCAVKTLSAGGDNSQEKSDEQASALYKRSYMFIGLGIACYMFVKFFSYYETMTADGQPFSAIVAQSLWDTVRRVGVLILIPLIIRNWRRAYNHKK